MCACLDFRLARDLSKNYFKDYPAKFSLNQLRKLNLSINSMTSFAGDFPNLTTLYVYRVDNSPN